MEQDTLIACEMHNNSKHRRAYTRRMNWRKAIRKRQIVQQYGFEWYNNLHQYSKNKIHCSCPLCRGEKFSNKRRIKAMEEQLNEEE